MVETSERMNIMNKFPIVSALIMIVAYIVAGFISHNLKKSRYEFYKKAEVAQRLQMKYMPVLGIDKFYADIEWIRLIQQMGDPKVKMDNDKMGKMAAKHFYKSLDRITDLNPDAGKIYLVGARQISNVEPEKAIALLNKADIYSTKRDWKRAQYCSFVEDQYIAARSKDEVVKKASLKRSEKYLRSALDQGAEPTYVENAWLRKRAALKGITNDPIGRLQMEKDYYDEKTMTEAGKDGTAGVNGGEGMGQMIYTDRSDPLRKKIISSAQKLALEYYQKIKSAKGKDVAKLKSELKKIKDIFYGIAPSGNYSDTSLVAYGAGDLFDVYTGVALKKPFGFCKFCESKGRHVITKGKYCHMCGRATTKSVK